MAVSGAVKELVLPVLVAGPADVSRLKRELESLDEYLHQASLRQAGDDAVKLPRTSRMLDGFSESNELNLLLPEDRARATSFLEQVKSAAPVITMSFAVDPSSAAVVKVVTWLRQNIHPLVLMRTGLQPNIAAGTILRTPSRLYDFSLRNHFAEQRHVLIEKINEAGKPHE